MKRIAVFSIAAAATVRVALALETPYVTDGLVAMWDAIENVGPGLPHDSAATTWVNLVDPDKYALTWRATYGAVNWSDNAANFTRTQGADGCGFFAGAFAYAAEMGANWTIEATVMADEGYFNNYSGICGNGNGGMLGKRLPYFGQYENGSLVTRVHDVQSGGISGVSVPSANLKLNALQTLSFSDSPTTFGFYINGTATASGSNGNTANSTVSDSADFRIGNCTEDLNRMFSGKIHCVRIYNRVLTDAERERNRIADFERYGDCVVSVQSTSDVLPDDFFSPGRGVHLGCKPGDSVTCTASAEPFEVEDWGVVSNATVTGWTIYTNSPSASAWAEWRKGDGTSCTFDHPGVAVRVVWNVGFTFVSRDSDSIRSYVHEGLVAMWDAHRNAGFGRPHDNAATTWVNLVDTNNYAMSWSPYKGERLWFDDAAVFTRSGLAGSGWWSASGFPYAALMGTSWTMEASVEPLGGYVSNYSGICGNGNGGNLPTFGQNENGVACFRVYPVRANPGTITLETSQTPIGELQTITYSDTPTSASVWVNDALQGSLENGSANNSTLGTSGDFRIGAAYSGGNYVFDGEIHCVRVYNRVLTAAERHQNYVTDMIRFGGMPKADTVTVVGDPQDVPSNLVSPSYGTHGGYARGETVTCVAPLDAVSIKCDTVITNAQVVGYEIYTNVVGDLTYAQMKKGKGTTCTFAHPGSATRVVWMWELSEVPNEEVTVGAYVTDGLIAMWDGENNAGLGSHSPSTTTWNNLADATKWPARWSPMSSGTVRWKDKCATFVNQHHTGHGVEGHGSFSAGDSALGAAMGDAWTIEASARPTQYYFNNYAGICGSDSSSAYICQYEVGKIVTRVYKAGKEKDPSGFRNIPASDFKADALWTVSFADSPTNMCFSTNGCVCATDVNKALENSTVSGSFSIGTGASGDARLFDGDIYNVRIYNRYLTADEIARNAFIDRVRFDGLGGVRYLGGELQCLTRVQTFGPMTASVNGGGPVASFAEWNDYASRTVTIAAETTAPRCVWRTTAGVPEGNALAVTTADPVDVVLDAYDPSAANQRVVDVAAAAGAVNAVAIGSLAGIQRIHVGAVDGGAGAAELTLGGKLRITVLGNGYAIVEPEGRSVGRAKIILFNGAQLTALDDAEVGDLVLFGGSMIELNGHALRYHSAAHRNRAGWDSGAKVVDSVGGGTFGYERLKQGLVFFLR